MGDLWLNLVPLVLGSAVVPAPLVVTPLLLRSSVRTAGAWVAGMAVARLLQGALFGLVLSDASTPATETPAGRTALVSGMLLVLGVALYVAAAQQLLGGDDPDTPPPRWMAMVESVRPGRAFLLGAGFVGISAKLWVFTLGALAAVEEAHVGTRAAVATYLAFVALALAPQLAALAFTLVAPGRARRLLERVAGRLQRDNRLIVIALGLVFGTWFLVKALRGLGVL